MQAKGAASLRPGSPGCLRSFIALSTILPAFP